MRMRARPGKSWPRHAAPRLRCSLVPAQIRMLDCCSHMSFHLWPLRHRAKCQSFYGKSGFACFRSSRLNRYRWKINVIWVHRTAAPSRSTVLGKGLLSNFWVKFLAGVFFPFVFIALANFLHVGSLCLQCSNVLFDVIVSACVCSSGRKFANLTVDKSACRTERALNTLECSPESLTMWIRR